MTDGPLPGRMPNYPTHARWGRIGAVVVAIAVGSAIYALAAAPLLAAVGISWEVRQVAG